MNSITGLLGKIKYDERSQKMIDTEMTAKIREAAHGIAKEYHAGNCTEAEAKKALDELTDMTLYLVWYEIADLDICDLHEYIEGLQKECGCKGNAPAPAKTPAPAPIEKQTAGINEFTQSWYTNFPKGRWNIPSDATEHFMESLLHEGAGYQAIIGAYNYGFQRGQKAEHSKQKKAGKKGCAANA